MTHVLAFVAAAADSLENSPPWELFKGIMLFCITTMLGVCGRMLFNLRDDVRDLSHELVGKDGTNGIKSNVRLLLKRVDAIEDRNIAIDAVNERERYEHPGPERRAGSRRLRDVVREGHDERYRRLEEDEPPDDPEAS